MSFRRNAAHKHIFYYTYNIPQSCYQLATVYIVRHSPRHTTHKIYDKWDKKFLKF